MTWHCPACNRHVPREQEACDCGFMKAMRGSLAAAREDSSGALWAIRAIALLMAGGVLALLWRLLA